MCDYSLCELQNRLAAVEEELVAHRFPTYSIGFASPANLEVAVCIPPGARLLLSGIPPYLQTRWKVSEQELVVFTQFSMEVNRHRDALCFSNGHESLLQNLTEGVRAQVISLGDDSLEDTNVAVMEEPDLVVNSL